VADVEKAISEFTARVEVFAQKLRLTRAVEPGRQARAEIEREVVGDVSRVVERRVTSAVASRRRGRAIARDRAALQGGRPCGDVMWTGRRGPGDDAPSRPRLRREALRVLEATTCSWRRDARCLARHAALAAALSQLVPFSCRQRAR
jgi:hypothetical protein